MIEVIEFTICFLAVIGFCFVVNSIYECRKKEFEKRILNLCGLREVKYYSELGEEAIVHQIATQKDVKSIREALDMLEVMIEKLEDKNETKNRR